MSALATKVYIFMLRLYIYGLLFILTVSLDITQPEIAMTEIQEILVNKIKKEKDKKNCRI